MTGIQGGNIFDRQFYRKIFLPLILLIFLIMPLLAISCEPVVPITVRNSTTETLTIFVDGGKIGEAIPQSEVKNTYIMHSLTREYTIVAKNSNGKTIYEETFSEKDLEWMKGRVLIPASRIQ